MTVMTKQGIMMMTTVEGRRTVIGMGGLVEPDSTGRAMDNEEGEKTVKKKRNACGWLLVVGCWLV